MRSRCASGISHNDINVCGRRRRTFYAIISMIISTRFDSSSDTTRIVISGIKSITCTCRAKLCTHAGELSKFRVLDSSDLTNLS